MKSLKTSIKANESRLASRILLAVLASIVSMSVGAQPVGGKPRLVVSIVVNDLEPEYIDLLRNYFTEKGFNRFLNQGVVINNVDYGTALDHTATTALLYTGAAPSTNGIAGGMRYDRDKKLPIEVLLDPDIIGNYTNQTYSPSALCTSTIADEVRIAGGGVTYVYAIAPDATQAIIQAGHAGNCGMWLNDKNANWATTTYYKDVPSVLTSRNRLKPLSQRLDTMSWTPLLKADKYPDLPDHVTRYPFRYTFARGNNNRVAMFKNSPLLNREITDIAIEHIDKLSLGSHDGTDMLNITYSLTPFSYTRNSENRYELMDAYHRLDHDLGRLFAAIEKTPGAANTLIYLAATPPSPRSRRDDEKWNIPTGTFSVRKAVSLLNMYLIAIHGNGEWIQGYHNGELFINHKLVSERNVDLGAIRAQSAEFLAKMSGVSEVFTLDDILSQKAGENAQALRRNTYVANAGDLRFTLTPGWQLIDDLNNTNLDESNKVTRSVASIAPVYIYYPPITPTQILQTVDARTIAPTVARLIRIRSPNAASVPPLQFK